MGFITGKSLYFIHIPKNAGTSIINSFPVTKYLGHGSYKMHRLHIARSRLNVKTFAIVRNPWDRFVSAYEYARMENSFWHNDTNPNPLYKIASSCSFDKFVKYIYNMRDKLNRIDDTALYHVYPQYIWMVDHTNTIKVDYVIRYENLENELSNIGLHTELKDLNKSPHTSYQSYYTDESKELIAKMYAKDIELFGYKFETFESIHNPSDNGEEEYVKSIINDIFSILTVVTKEKLLKVMI